MASAWIKVGMKRPQARPHLSTAAKSLDISLLALTCSVSVNLDIWMALSKSSNHNGTEHKLDLSGFCEAYRGFMA